MIKSKGYVATSSTSLLVPFSFERRELRPHDVLIEILYCGVCHSDIHQARNEWKRSNYPMVPGHEIVGKVSKIGKKVTKFKEGDIVGVGCMVDSCQKCENCKLGLDQYCLNGSTYTYNSKDKVTGEPTYGGYSNNIVVTENFILKIPKKLVTKSSAPLLCAGITTYSALRHWKVKKGDKVGIIGLGGLGHVAIKIAKAMGAYVVVFTTSPQKEKDALRLGAHEVVASTNTKEMEKHIASFDFLLSTIPTTHDFNPYIKLLKLDKTLTILGAMEPIQTPIDGGLLAGKRRNIAGSDIGGIAETQEMLNFCAKHNITCDVEVINIQDINKAYERMKKSDVKYRFVIDLSSLK